jgi:hypothetical protein
MNRWLMSGALGVGMASLVLSPLAKPLAAQGVKKGNWLKDYGSAKAAAQQSGKPIFLVFR